METSQNGPFVRCDNKKISDVWHNFGRLGDLTGGGLFTPDDMSAQSVLEILESVVGDGEFQYAVGFTPQRSSAMPKEHTLEVKLASKSKDKVVGGKRKAIY